MGVVVGLVVLLVYQLLTRKEIWMGLMLWVELDGSGRLYTLLPFNRGWIDSTTHCQPIMRS